MTATTLPEPVAAALRRFVCEQRDADGRVTWPGLPREALAALRDGLRNNDPALVQHHIALCGPEPLRSAEGVWDHKCAGGCLVGYGLWKGGTAGAEQVRDGYYRLARTVAVGDLTGWFDNTPPAESFPLLAAECDAILAEVAA